LTRFGVLQDLNETARFIQNNAVSSIQKKKKKRKRAERCCFERHCSSFFFPPEHAAGKKGKMVLFFEIFVGPSLSPGAHRPNTMADHPPRTTHRTSAAAPNGRPADCSPREL
jgi:hypothetical protein